MYFKKESQCSGNGDIYRDVWSTNFKSDSDSLLNSKQEVALLMSISLSSVSSKALVSSLVPSSSRDWTLAVSSVSLVFCDETTNDWFPSNSVSFSMSSALENSVPAEEKI